jgi:hypothetical protein
MASATEDAEQAARRLEAALERIARLAHGSQARAVPAEMAEIKERLDRIIDRLRLALDGSE